MGVMKRMMEMKLERVRGDSLPSGKQRPSMWFRMKEYNVAYDLRVLPPLDSMDIPWLPHARHYKQIAGMSTLYEMSGTKRAITCPRFHQKKHCPICEITDWCEEHDTPQRGLAYKVKYLMNVVHDGQLMVWEAPATVVKRIRAILLSDDYGPELIDPECGRSIKVTRTGSPGDISTIGYEVVPAARPSRIAVPDWEENAQNLPNLIKLMTYDEILDVVSENLEEHLSLGKILPALGKKRGAKRPSRKRVASGKARRRR